MPLTYRIVIAQLIAVVVVAVGMSLVEVAESRGALIGGVVSVLPAAWFAWRAHRTRRGAVLVAQGAVKSLAAIGLMVVAFVSIRPAPLGFFTALVAAQAMYLVVPLLSARQAGIPK
ncbi:MAG: ATP synthase subunit I [Proteobacteria bacterium]|nr:ATP synthase subunit I [Pseudomonadota bacterium]